ncbi:hypothetical protein PCG10_010679 [Penicillium crustosum]|uniref:Uncharacterized protein n=1 Tax=Penicillium crustosum TaxID=36656 RepID=A0A9P5L0K3_PENCR|nr:hypothetical protein PCG10_010679 [Penicillium crustosum]
MGPESDSDYRPSSPLSEPPIEEGRLQVSNLPDVPHQMYDTVRGRQTRQAPIQTKQGERIASVKSHSPHLFGKKVETIEVASHNATMRNFALSSVYSGYKLAVL